MLSISITSFAGEWRVVHENADELIGNPDYDMFLYLDGQFQFGYSTKDSMIYIRYKNCVFDCEYSTLYQEYGEYVLVGLYNSSGELIEKGRLYMSANNDMDIMHLYDYSVNEGWNKKIINHLQTRGYVRIVADAYSCKMLDFKIPGYRR